MSHQDNLTKATLRTPRAAAVAGIIFSVMLFLAFWLLRVAIPTGPAGSNAWLGDYAKTLAVALSLIPFSGIAFLWLIGVLRDRLGPREDRLLATVFLGSGLLFLAMLFSAAAVASAAVTVYSSSNQEIDIRVFAFARTLVSDLMNIYAVKMAGVFMFSLSTVAIYTGFAPRYIGFLGYGLALFLLFGNPYLEWSFLVFPVWVLLLSTHVLANDLRRRSQIRDLT
jgi:HAMP domain-containing protein